MYSDELPTVAITGDPLRIRYLVRRLLAVTALVVLGGSIGLAAAGRLPTITSSAADGQEVATGAPEGPATLDGNQTGLSSETSSTDEAGSESDSVATDTTSEGANGGDDAGSPADVAAIALPDRASRFVAQAPQRLLDSREAGDVPAPDTEFVVDVAPARTTVVLSLSVMNSVREGTVLVDGRAGVVEAITITKPGTTTTNLVFLPVTGEEISIRSTGGGHLVVDVVGSFEASEATTAGRFVPVGASGVTRLETAVDGREADIEFGSSVPVDRAAAMLVAINADVGTEGGMVRLGSAPAAYDQMLMWAPAASENNGRRGLAIIQPGDEGLAALRYEGGSILTVDVIGYFTNDSAELSEEGLYVPTGPRQLFDGLLEGDRSVQVPELDRGTGTAVMTVGTRTGIPGQLGAVLAPISEGALTISSDTELDALITLLGVFLT